MDFYAHAWMFARKYMWRLYALHVHAADPLAILGLYLMHAKWCLTFAARSTGETSQGGIGFHMPLAFLCLKSDNGGPLVKDPILEICSFCLKWLVVHLYWDTFSILFMSGSGAIYLLKTCRSSGGFYKCLREIGFNIHIHSFELSSRPCYMW